MLRPVGHHAERADPLSVGVSNRAGPEQRPQLGSVLAHIRDVLLLREALSRMLDAQRRCRSSRVGHDVEQRRADQLIHPIAEHVGEPLVDECDGGFGINDRDAFVRGLDDAAVTRLALAQRGLGPGEQYRRLAPGIDHRIDLVGEQRLDGRLGFREPLVRVEYILSTPDFTCGASRMPTDPRFLTI